MASDADLFKYDQGTSRRYFHAWKLSVLSGSELVVYRLKESNQFLNGWITFFTIPYRHSRLWIVKVHLSLSERLLLLKYVCCYTVYDMSWQCDNLIGTICSMNRPALVISHLLCCWSLTIQDHPCLTDFYSRNMYICR